MDPVIAAALIGLGGVILGGVVAVGATYWLTERRHKRERKEALRNFILGVVTDPGDLRFREELRVERSLAALSALSEFEQHNIMELLAEIASSLDTLIDEEE